MIRRPTWILLAIFAVSAAFAWYLESSPSRMNTRQTPSPTPVARLLPDIDSLSMTRIEVTGAAGEHLVLARDNQGQYLIEGKAGLKVDQGAAIQLASELSALEISSGIQSTISEEKIGLTVPRATLVVENANGARHTLIVGSETPVGTGYYLRVDSQPPVVVSKEGMDRIIALAAEEILLAPTETNAGPAVSQTPAAASTP